MTQTGALAAFVDHDAFICLGPLFLVCHSLDRRHHQPSKFLYPKGQTMKMKEDVVYQPLDFYFLVAGSQSTLFAKLSNSCTRVVALPPFTIKARLESRTFPRMPDRVASLRYVSTSLTYFRFD